MNFLNLKFDNVGEFTLSKHRLGSAKHTFAMLIN